MAGAQGTLADYPKMGIWPDGLYMTANMFDCLDSACGSASYKEARAYALLIALTRVALTAHFPSDVLAGAFIGAAGAICVRRWFAARRLAFVPDEQGIIRPLAGPSFSRLKRLARRLLA